VAEPSATAPRRGRKPKQREAEPVELPLDDGPSGAEPASQPSLGSDDAAIDAGEPTASSAFTDDASHDASDATPDAAPAKARRG